MYDLFFANANYINILGNTIGGILGGIFLAIMFFLLKEKVFHTGSLRGKWYIELTTTESSYNPYKNMILQHVLFLNFIDNQITGTSEKIYEDSSIGMKRNHIIHYLGSNRTRTQLDGSIEKNYLGSHIISLHAVESGEKRTSTVFYTINVRRRFWYFGGYKFSDGEFYSMIADQKGTFEISRVSFHQKNAKIDEPLVAAKNTIYTPSPETKWSLSLVINSLFSKN